jgi:hypothetical protein
MCGLMQELEGQVCKCGSTTNMVGQGSTPDTMQAGAARFMQRVGALAWCACLRSWARPPLRCCTPVVPVPFWPAQATPRCWGGRGGRQGRQRRLCVMTWGTYLVDHRLALVLAECGLGAGNLQWKAAGVSAPTSDGSHQREPHESRPVA